VRVNGEELGPSPVRWRFDHYGEVLVEAEHPGHRPVQRVVRLEPPWYQRPVVDFFADVVWPARVEDEHHVTLRLPGDEAPTEKEKDEAIARLVHNARALRGKAEAGKADER